MIVYKDTGYTLNNRNNVICTISYNSGLTNPSIRIKMLRRKYDMETTTEYVTVDLTDYVSNTFLTTANANEYLILNNPTQETTLNLSMKDDLTPGTYRLDFMLYDNSSLIGTVEKYIIIKQGVHYMKELNDKELIDLYETILQFVKSLEDLKDGVNNDKQYSKRN